MIEIRRLNGISRRELVILFEIERYVFVCYSLVRCINRVVGVWTLSNEILAWNWVKPFKTLCAYLQTAGRV